MRFRNMGASAALRHLESFGSSVPSLLSRRTNIRSLAEIEAARRGPAPADGSWRNGLIVEDDGSREPYCHEKRAERDRQIKELRLAKKPVTEIMFTLGLTYGQVQASIYRQGLAGIGGAAKNRGWRAQAARAASISARLKVDLANTDKKHRRSVLEAENNESI